jgi:hypothetical protein
MWWLITIAECKMSGASPLIVGHELSFLTVTQYSVSEWVKETQAVWTVHFQAQYVFIATALLESRLNDKFICWCFISHLERPEPGTWTRDRPVEDFLGHRCGSLDQNVASTADNNEIGVICEVIIWISRSKRCLKLPRPSDLALSALPFASAHYYT